MQSKLIILMKENGVTIRSLASKIGISEKQLGNKLRGSAEFKSSEMFKISKLFNKSIDDIFLPSMYENGTK